jgi:hypothetical protein
MKLQELIKDEFLDEMKKKNIQSGTKIQFFGDTGRRLDVWKTYYFVRYIDMEGRKESGAVLSPNKNLDLVRNGRYIGFHYKHSQIRKGGASGSRPNTYNLDSITDMKIG